METKTEIIVEDDEMEDGSIFVCFMCEEEFSKVSLLNAHMQLHNNMPEMTKEFRRRRGRGRGQGSGSGRPRGRGRGRGQGRGASMPVLVDLETTKGDAVYLRQQTGSITAKEDTVYLRQETSNRNVKKDEPIYIKQEADTNRGKKETENSSLKKAQRIRQYFQNRLLSSGRGGEKKTSTLDDSDDFDEGGWGVPLAEDEIMMVPQPSKKNLGSVSSKRSPSTAVMATDSVFHAPSPSPSIAPASNKRVKLRKKLIVQEVVYEEVEDDDDGEEIIRTISSVPASKTTPTSCTTTQIVMKEKPSHKDFVEPEEEDLEIDEDEGEIIELSEDDEVFEFPSRANKEGKKPGRRSQPRGTDEGPGIPCEECGKEFRSITTLRVHARAHLEVKDIPCPYCDEVFPQRHVLHQHLVNDHEQSNNLTCSICAKVFTRTDSLKSHMVRMHEEDGGLNCYICGKNFPSQGQLEMHVRVHTGERPFKCDYCHKGFIQKVHLRTHLRTMHNMHEIQSTPCRICNAMLDGRAGLRDHYNSVHGLTNNQYKSRVAKLRKEGKIPELPPPVVKEVDPSLNYFKVSVSELTAATSSATTTTTQVRKNVKRGGNRGRPPRKVPKVVDSDSSSVETTTYCDADTTYGAAEVKFEVDGDVPKRRDQEELNIVESAFKVAEQMDQLGANVPGSTTILVAGQDSATTGVYYAIPVVMENNTQSTTTTTTTTNIIQTAPATSNQEVTTQESVTATVTSTVTANGTPMISTTTSDASSLQPVQFGQEEIDDEYAQFAAEHSHMESDSFQAEELSDKGSIVRAEPLQLFTDPNDPLQSETVEMFTM